MEANLLVAVVRSGARASKLLAEFIILDMPFLLKWWRTIWLSEGRGEAGQVFEDRNTG